MKTHRFDVYLTDDEFNEFVKQYEENRRRFEALKSGERIYEVSPQGMMDFDVFEMEVVEVNIPNRKVTVKDHSQRGIIREITVFITEEEVKKYL